MKSLPTTARGPHVTPGTVAFGESGVRVVDGDADVQRARELGERGRARCADGLAGGAGPALAEAVELVAEALELLPVDDDAW
ncbi:hypothetical protein, partial [Streptomyces sp. SID3343]